MPRTTIRSEDITAGEVKSDDIASVSTGYFDLPAGTTAQRPGTPNSGYTRFNSTTNSLEVHNGTSWVSFAAPTPSVTSIAPTTAATTGTSVVITGTDFDSNDTVTIVGDDGTVYTPGTTTFGSSTQWTITTPALTVANEPYDIKIANSANVAGTLPNALDAGGTPVWTTASGTVATIADTATGTHATLVATDPDGTAITFAETTNILTTANLSLASGGAITGDPNNVGSQTTYNFNVNASDGVNTTNRAFAIIVNVGNDGTTAARAAITAQDLLNVSAASGTYWVFIHGTAYQMTYDSTDKFSNGVSGWLKFDDQFVAGYNSASNIQFSQAGSSVDAAWSNSSQGEFYLGDDGDSQTSAVHMGRVTMKMPKCRYGVMNTVTASGSGAQTPDDSTSWLSDATMNAVVNTYCALAVPTIANADGYPFAIWNGVSTATTANNGIILPKPGGELGSVSGSVTKTFAGGDFSVHDFTAIVSADPYFVAWSGDSGYERYTFNDYELWIH